MCSLTHGALRSLFPAAEHYLYRVDFPLVCYRGRDEGCDRAEDGGRFRACMRSMTPDFSRQPIAKNTRRPADNWPFTLDNSKQQQQAI